MSDELNDDQIAELSRTLRKSLVHYPAPEVLRARIHSALADADASPAPTHVAPPGRPGGVHRWRLIAAAVLVAAVSSGVTYEVGRRAGQRAHVENEILASHLRSLIPGHLVDVASTDQHNVKPWFAGRVPLSPPVPRLDSAGFRLVGGRIDYISGHTTAVVVYAIRQHTINVFSQVDAVGGDEQRQLQGYNVIAWRDGGVEYWAVSDLNAAELAAFTRAYRGVKS